MIGVVTSVAYLEVRSFEQHIEADLVDSARLGAQSAADDVAQRALPLDPLDIRDTLHDLVEADPVLDAISVIEADETGRLRVFTSTSTEERAEVLDLAGTRHRHEGARPAIATARRSRSRCRCRVARTTPWRSRSAWRACSRRATHGLRVALGFAVPTIVLVTILVHFTVRQLLGQPLDAILRTMEETAGGDLRARTTMIRRDELGTIADGLNEMLDQLERFNRSLQERIEEATAICRSATRNWRPARASCSRCANRSGAPSASRRWVRSPPTSPIRRARR